MGRASMWMELCEGDFEEVVAVTHSAPVAEVELLGLQFLEQTARALKVLHAAGMVHADLKPNNVLVSKFHESVRASFALGTLKLSDFGQAYQESQWRRLRRPSGNPWVHVPRDGRPQFRRLALLPGPGDALGHVLPGASVWYVMTGKRYCADNTAVNEWILSNFTAHTQHLLRSLLAAVPDQCPTAEDLLRNRVLRRHPVLLAAPPAAGGTRGARGQGGKGQGA